MQNENNQNHGLKLIKLTHKERFSSYSKRSPWIVPADVLKKTCEISVGQKLFRQSVHQGQQ